MYEYTHKGLWFRWSALDRSEKRMAGTSLVGVMFSMIGLVAVSRIPTDNPFYRLGYWIGSDGMSAPLTEPRPSIVERTWGADALALWSLATMAVLIVSVWLWVKFSKGQDELFNRIQNETVGLGCALAALTYLLWYLLASGGLVGHLEAFSMLLIVFAGMGVALVRAYQRWA